MANPVDNTLTVIGLPEGTDITAWLKKFARDTEMVSDLQEYGWMEAMNVSHALEDAELAPLSKEDIAKLASRAASTVQYYHIEQTDPWQFENVSYPRFRFTSRWVPPIKKLTEASKSYSDLTFHLSSSEWWEDRRGVYVISNGKIGNQWDTGDAMYSLSSIYNPDPDFLVGETRLTLPQRAKYRLLAMVQNVTDIADALEYATTGMEMQYPDGQGGYLPPVREPFTSFDKLRDAEKTKRTVAALNALRDSLKSAVDAIDFTDVLIDLLDPRRAADLGLTVNPDKDGDPVAQISHPPIDDSDDIPF